MVVASSAQRAKRSPRLVSISQTGRYAAIRQVDGVGVVDALGTNPRRNVSVPGLIDFACIGKTLWAVGEGKLHRFRLDTCQPVPTDAELVGDAGVLLAAPTRVGRAALWRGETAALVVEVGDELEVIDIGDELSPKVFAAPLGGRRLLIGQTEAIRIRDVGRGDVVAARLPHAGEVVAAASLFAGKALGVLCQTEDKSGLVVLRNNGSVIHNVQTPMAMRASFAENRGLAFLHTEDAKLTFVDLRYGRVLSRVDPPIPVSDLAVDADGKNVVIAGWDDNDQLSVIHVPYTDLFTGDRNRAGRGAEAEDEDEAEQEEPAETEPTPKTPRGRSGAHKLDTAAPAPPRVDAAAGEALPLPEEVEAEGDDEPIEVPDVPLEGLGRIIQPLVVNAPPGVAPYQSHREHLDDLLELVAARAARSIADAWDSGRLSLPAHDSRPFEREVHALVGARASGAPEELAAAEERLAQLTSSVGRRAQASLAAGHALPFIDIAREFDLTTTAAQVLLVVAAPALRGEIARLYGVLANDENRPICDRHLVQTILAGDHRATRHAIAKELAGDAPLIRCGLVRVVPTPHDQYLFAPLTVDPVLLSRMRGNPEAGAGPGAISSVRYADKDLDELALPDEIKRDAVIGLYRPAHDGKPARVVVRGRPGSGRKTFLASLAARARRMLAVIDAERLPRGGRPFADRMRTELRRANLRGAVPCVTGLAGHDSADLEGIEHIREVFRSHPGAVTFCTSPEFKPPLDPGYIQFTLPPLSEGERLEFWKDALARADLEAERVEELAARFRVGPGTIENIIATTISRRAAEPDPDPDASEDLDRAARQHIDARLGNVATRVSRLATWEQVALPEDVFDSIKEFIGRVSHRRTVYENWGYDRKMSTSRGLTALFHGPPGTGKSMVAGLIARELQLDLYRVDLARITSKWIGETEKNLAEIFDAAEDGQAVILFDEADSLFAKRTEVKSSVDRYANLEVNYLLQRLDTFDGVAILTTNLEGSLDNAFKRRLSLRLAFPFPDEEMRVRLWAAHIPPEVPTEGDFDLADLAKRFPMSGGYIRNSALRAAFLAAQENRPLSQEHLERAIQLEYREMGKLSASGRME